MNIFQYTFISDILFVHQVKIGGSALSFFNSITKLNTALPQRPQLLHLKISKNCLTNEDDGYRPQWQI